MSFEVPRGRLCALLGPNGAGKTTTVRMLLGLLAPSSGSASVAGIALPTSRDGSAALRARAGLLTETPGFYDRLSGRENLDFFGRLYGIEPGELFRRNEQWLQRLGLWEARDRPFGTYSKGMKQRLALIRAVFHEPEVIFLDEPTAGLDPAAAREVRALVGGLRSEGRTILLCTHHLGEAEQLADFIGIIQRRLLRFGSPAELAGSDTGLLVRLAGDAALFSPVLEKLRGVTAVRSEAGTLDIETDASPEAVPAVVSKLAGLGARILEVRPRRPSLEEIYLRAVAGE